MKRDFVYWVPFIYGPIREVNEVTDEIVEDKVAEFERLKLDFRYNWLEIDKN